MQWVEDGARRYKASALGRLEAHVREAHPDPWQLVVALFDRAERWR